MIECLQYFRAVTSKFSHCILDASLRGGYIVSIPNSIGNCTEILTYIDIAPFLSQALAKRFLVMIIDNKKVVLSRKINYNVSFHMHSDFFGMTGERGIFSKISKK